MAQSAGNPASGGYPYAIRGDDLDKNFVAATAIYDEEHFEVTETAGLGGHNQPKVKLKQILPTPPANGFQILGGENNAYSFLTGQKAGALVSWFQDIIPGEYGGWGTIAPTNNGQIPFFKIKEGSPATEQWTFLTPKKDGQLFYWYEAEGEWRSIEPTADGQMLYWHSEEKKWKLLPPGTEGSFPQWNQTDKWRVRGGANKDAVLKFNVESKEWQPFTPPATGTHVLGAVDGVLQWISTEEC